MVEPYSYNNNKVLTQYKVDAKGQIKCKQDKENPADKSIHLFKGFNNVLRSISFAIYQPFVGTEPII